MTDSELISILKSAESNASIYNSEFMHTNKNLLSAYFGNATGEFSAPENSSSVVSSDVFDLVESDMPSLMRIFTGSGDIITFQPNTSSESDIQEAEEKTKYINHIVREQPDSFNILQTWLKDAETQKNGIVKFFIDERKEVETVEYENVSLEELQSIEESLKGSNVDKVKVEISDQDETSDNTFDIKFRVTTESEDIKIINVPPETFLITKNARNLKDAELVGDKGRRTRGDLLSDGYPKDLINKLQIVSSERITTVSAVRNRNSNTNSAQSSIKNWASEYVEVCDLYVKVDFDDDGIAERRHIIFSGNYILENEPFALVPYASLSTTLIPHKAIGMSRAEPAYKYQKIQTALKRGILNNIYMVNNPRNVVHDDVDLDDMLANRINGIIRLESGSQILPQQAVFPLSVPYIGDRALQVSQFFDSTRAQSTGSLLANQGLDADKISKETATRFNGVQNNSDAKIELIARNYAETGFRDLYDGCAWLASRFQNTKKEIRVLGKELKINPSQWKYKQNTKAEIGLGAGNNEKSLQSLQGIYLIQSQLKSQNSLLVDDEKLYNTLNRITDGMGMPRVEEFFNNTKEPDDILKSHNEQLNKLALKQQQDIQQLSAKNPLAEAEKVKQQGLLLKAQSDTQLNILKLQSSNEEWKAKLIADKDKSDHELALKLTEIETKFNQELSKSNSDNLKGFEDMSTNTSQNDN